MSAFDAIPAELVRLAALRCGKPGAAKRHEPDADGVSDGFDLVDVYGGELANIENLERDLAGLNSCALLAFESETETREGVATLSGKLEQVMQATWAFVVFVRDSRNARAALLGAPHTPGCWAYARRLQDAINGETLLDPETGERLLWMTSTVQLIGKRTLFQRQGIGQGVAVRFGTRYVSDSVVPTWATVPRQVAHPLASIEAAFHLEGAPATDRPPDPIVEFTLPAPEDFP